jgi:cytochrome d ubiquinol oxidase subunit I
MTAERQPLKLAAFEALFETTTRAPLIIGGVPDLEEETVHYALEIPGLLSFLAFGDFDATVQGLKDFPREEWPPVLVTHFAFQIMVGIGFFLALVGALLLLALWKRPHVFTLRPVLLLLGLCIPLGFIAIEAGWTVTEVGRQPWIIYGLLKTSEALTPRPGVMYTLLVYSIVYTILTLVLAFLMWRQIAMLHRELENRQREVAT